ncbi:hypothetical protein KKF11_03235 [Patescibacteria group bacterium]|nr:hypothetical protein [Patescibacteria group bacterium]
MNKKIWGLAILTVGVGMLVVLFLSIFVVKWRVDLSQREGDNLYRLSDKKRVGQTFIAGKNNLSRLTLDLKNASLKNEKPVYFHLRQVDGPGDLRKIKISGFNIGDPSSVRFQFEPIPDSFQKKYYFYLDSPDSSDSDGIEVYYSSQDLYSGGEMMINDQEAIGDLRFSSFYFSDSKMTVFRETIGNFTSRLLTDKTFTALYLTLLILTFSSGLLLNRPND